MKIWLLRSMRSGEACIVVAEEEAEAVVLASRPGSYWDMGVALGLAGEGVVKGLLMSDGVLHQYLESHGQD